MLQTRQFATIALVVMLVSQAIFLVNFFVSIFKGKKAERNPYQANTLEWTAPSPPGHGNFEEMPTVYRGPYEYSVEGVKAIFDSESAELKRKNSHGCKTISNDP